MRIRMRDLLGRSVLAGALTGRKALGLLLERLGAEPDHLDGALLIYLDFDGIDIATASFLRECVLEFREIVRRRWSRFYPVVANANSSVTEEMSVLVAQRDVLVSCTLQEDGTTISPRLVGSLEPKQRLTLDLVQRLGETDAGELRRVSEGTEEVGHTAWNNRLASLSRLGLLIELSRGKRKRYRPLLQVG